MAMAAERPEGMCNDWTYHVAQLMRRHVLSCGWHGQLQFRKPLL